MSGLLARRNLRRVRAADPVGVEYLARQLLPGEAAHQASNESPALQNVERGRTYQVTVTNVGQLILPADLNRKMLYVVNNDAIGVVTISFGAPAVNNVGMRASAGGGGFLLDNNVPTAPVYMIGTIANNPNVSLVVA